MSQEAKKLCVIHSIAIASVEKLVRPQTVPFHGGIYPARDIEHIDFTAQTGGGCRFYFNNQDEEIKVVTKHAVIYTSLY